MNEHFIKNIEIKNFKCFKDFKAEGFGRVNLIGGKNNVGKTAFMEACYINSHAQNIKHFITALADIYFMRNFLNIQENKKNMKEQIERLNNIFVNSNINKIYFMIKEEEGIKKYYFEYNQNIIEPNSNDFSFSYDRVDNIHFIDSLGMSNEQIIQDYSAVQKRDDETYLNSVIKKFDSRIENFKVFDDFPQCKFDGKWLEIIELGDGVRHLISIVVSLYSAENGYLYVDEIDNGIHYTMLDELWTILLEVSKKLNVQVFATTHSKECIESYARVAKKLEETDIKFLSLYKNKEDELKSITFDYEKIQDRIELGLDNR